MTPPALSAHVLEDATRQFQKYKGLADAALAQVSDADLFRTIDPESNSIALVMKHLSGNMQSRWRDFLHTDGEKPDRHRDREFESEPGETKARVFERWESGWALLFETLGSLRGDDLQEIVRIRGEKHTVLEAIHRQLTHYAYHVGQIVFLARHLTGSRWNSLSIPKGKSSQFDVAKNGSVYRAPEDGDSGA